ncbi:hypothetical protein [Streptomyces sp. NPDC002526]
MADTQPLDVQLPPLPDGITRDSVCEAIRLLGLDPTAVQEMTLSLDGITAELLLRTSEAQAVYYGCDAATTVVSIPVV